jgi:hypothetical protein
LGHRLHLGTDELYVPLKVLLEVCGRFQPCHS